MHYTNGVEKANSLVKTCNRKISLYGAMQSLYEKNKMFALQYIMATDGLKISYRSAADQTQHSNSSLKRKPQQEPVKDNECSFGPPDKKQHFGTMQGKKSRKARESLRQMIEKKRHQTKIKKLKCCMWMASGTKDGYLVSILTQENGKLNFMMITKQQK